MQPLRADKKNPPNMTSNYLQEYLTKDMSFESECSQIDFQENFIQEEKIVFLSEPQDQNFPVLDLKLKFLIE